MSDGDDVADAYQGKETDSEEDCRQHRAAVDVGEKRLDDAHIVVTDEVERSPGDEQHTTVEPYGEQLVGSCDIAGAVADKQQVLEFRRVLLYEQIDAQHEDVEAQNRDDQTDNHDHGDDHGRYILSPSRWQDYRPA